MPLPKIAITSRQEGDLLCIDLTVAERKLSVSRILTDPSSCNFRIDNFELARMLRNLAAHLESDRS